MKSFEKHPWEQVRARGRGHFIWREGILRYGFATGSSFAFGWFLKDLLKHQLDGSEIFAIAAMFGSYFGFRLDHGDYPLAWA